VSVASLAAERKDLLEACTGELGPSLGGDAVEKALGSGIKAPSPGSLGCGGEGPTNPYAQQQGAGSKTKLRDFDEVQKEQAETKKAAEKKAGSGWFDWLNLTPEPTAEPKTTPAPKPATTPAPKPAPIPLYMPGPTAEDGSRCADLQRFIWECEQSGWRTGECEAFLNSLDRCADMTIAYVTEDGELPCFDRQAELTPEQIAALEADCSSLTRWGPDHDPCGATGPPDRENAKLADCITKGQTIDGNGCPQPEPIDAPDAPECPPPVPGVPPFSPCPPPGGPVPGPGPKHVLPWQLPATPGTPGDERPGTGGWPLR
jgi:hypothetical protein